MLSNRVRGSGLFKCHQPLLSLQHRSLSAKIPPEKAEDKNQKIEPLTIEKKVSIQTQRLVDTLKSNYTDTLKFGKEWYLDKVNIITKRKNEMGGNEWYSAKVGFWMKRYENFVGLTEVKAAQCRVVETEKLFIAAQDERREAQAAINEVQKRIKALHGELEKTHRGEDRYLSLITQEHQVLKEERHLTDNLIGLERAERLRFSELSNAVRDSHEKERAQAEKTKYWSVIGSVVGTCLGILGTTINNRLRMKELRQIVRDASNGAVVIGTSVDEISFQKIQSLIEGQKKEILDISQKAAASNSEVIKKLSEVGQISTFLTENVSQARLELANSTPVVAGITSKELNSFFESQQKIWEKLFADLKSALVSNTQSTNERLTADTAKRAAEMERRLLDSLNRLNTASYKAFHTRACDIDEKVKDVRSLILAQAMSSVNPGGIGPTSNSGEDFERSQRTIIGTVELALRDHEERLRSSVVLAGIFTAILTPIVLYALNRIA